MLVIHHLNMSRSERVVWLAEELGLKYQLVHHRRDAKTFRSPKSLWDISPTGKSPVIQDSDKVICESGAVIEYLVECYGKGRLKPPLGSNDFIAYLHWMHAAESTLMSPILLEIIATLTSVESGAMKSFIDGEYKTVLSFLDKVLSESAYVAGASFSAADIMVTYDLHLANGTSFPSMRLSAPIEDYPSVVAYIERIETRAAYNRMRELCAET